MTNTTTTATATLIKEVDGRIRLYPIGAPIPVRTHLGDGRLVYATDDQRLGVQLIGETRVDEYRPDCVTRLSA